MKNNKKIKIMAISTSTLLARRGTPIRINSILSGLSKYDDIELVIFSSDKKIPIDVEHHYISGSRLNNLKTFYNYIKNNQVDIIIGHCMTTWLYLFVLRFITKAKIVLEMHGFFEEEAKMNGSISNFRYNINKFYYNFFYMTPHLITTCSKTATKILSKYNNNVKTVFGGVDLKIFNPNIESDSIIKKEGIIIGYAGNFRPVQGIDFLFEAYQELVKDYPEFKLKVLTSHEDIPEKYTKYSKVEIFNNFKHDMVSKFLIDCDIIVIPRPDTEVGRISFPSKLIEDMAMGKAVVGSRTSDMHEIIEDEVNGLLFNPGDKEGFIKCLIKLRDREIRKRLGVNAFKFVRDNLTWEHQVNNIYKELLKINNN